MIDVRIVCTHDALSFVETLMRLLTAEEHRVRLVYGRHSLTELEEAQAERDAIILVWSYDAPSQHYMLEWARRIEPARLVEVSRAPGAPKSDRRAPVIDFGNWRGDRGARAWSALNDRLRTVARAMEPPKPPPKRAALALGLVSAAAVTSAIFVRAHEAFPTSVEETTEIKVAARDSSDALGGPLVALEPASMDDAAPLMRATSAHVSLLEVSDAEPLMDLTTETIPNIRRATLLERLEELNPLRSNSNRG